MFKYAKTISYIALLLSLLPIYLAKISYVYTNYCLTAYWYSESPICKLDLSYTFIATAIYFIVLFGLMLIGVNLIRMIILLLLKK